jgi:phytoene dehydrogenase-like protein
MSEPSVIIVGGGIAGLSAGIYARLNGYRATILEAHRIPGGLCTAWKRKGYTFDISMHVFMHANHGPLHAMWSELGALEGRSFHYHREFGRIESQGRTVVYGPDAALLERQLLAISQADAPRIRQFVRLLHGPGFGDLLPLDPAALTRPVDKLRSLASLVPLLPALLRCGKDTIQDFAARFRDPFLRQAVRFVIDAPGWPMVGFPLLALAGFFNAKDNDVSVPLGGSQGVVFAMADRFKALGGELRLGTRVADLIVETDRAAGVRLEDGTELRADTVIWAADGHHLIYDLLEGRYVNDTVRAMYERWTPVRSLVHVCLGVARDLSREPARLVYELDEPITVAGEGRRWLSVLHHGFDPSSAPAGKTALEVWYPTDHAYWERLAGDREAYAAEKRRITELTLKALEQRWPGISADVEVVDVPTPATYVRYTGNWQGSPDGWYITHENSRAEPLRTLPGLSDLFMVGQWTAPFAGTPISALTGRQVVQVLCHRDGVPFRTSQPG